MTQHLITNHTYRQPISEVQLRAALARSEILELHEELVKRQVPHNVEHTGGGNYALTCAIQAHVFVASWTDDDEFLLTGYSPAAWLGEEDAVPLLWSEGSSAAEVVTAFEAGLAGRRDFLPESAGLYDFLADRFIYRDCAQLAATISRVTNWPVVVVSEGQTPEHIGFVHAGVRTPAGTVLDARGEHDVDEWLDEYGDHYVQDQLRNPDFDPDVIDVVEVDDMTRIDIGPDFTPDQQTVEAATALLMIHHEHVPAAGYARGQATPAKAAVPTPRLGVSLSP